MITAKKVYKEILEMPLKERERLFGVIARRGFEKEVYTHNEVFDDIRNSPFTIREAAEYLEVAEITVRRWVKEGLLKSEKIGRNIVFDADKLKAFKRHRQNIVISKSAAKLRERLRSKKIAFTDSTRLIREDRGR